MSFQRMRGWRTGVLPILVFCCLPLTGAALDVSNRYRSPRNPERKVRASTELIVLHTTEAPARSSLNKLSERGEAHYCVTEEGSVYRIVDRDREAFHAGRSMWRGREDVDKFSIGIECVGYHDKPMSAPQLGAIRDLVKALQKMYRISDDQVVCHSHVAYGAPNRWQKRRHRGRKRCGMLFAMPSVRRLLSLGSRPAFDADTRAGRLAVGDAYLQGVLYGKTDTMVGRCATPATSSGGWLKSLFGRARPPPPPAAATPVGRSPPQPKAVVGPRPVVGQKAVARPRTVAQLQAQGYVQKGVVSPKVTASKIAGRRWNAADTFYVIRNKVIPGSEIQESRIEKGMRVWMKK